MGDCHGDLLLGAAREAVRTDQVNRPNPIEDWRERTGQQGGQYEDLSVSFLHCVYSTTKLAYEIPFRTPGSADWPQGGASSINRCHAASLIPAPSHVALRGPIRRREESGSRDGGQRAAILYSLIQTCKVNGVEPFAYLRDVIQRVSTHPMSRIEELTPRGWKAAREQAAAPATA